MLVSLYAGYNVAVGSAACDSHVTEETRCEIRDLSEAANKEAKNAPRHISSFLVVCRLLPLNVSIAHTSLHRRDFRTSLTTISTTSTATLLPNLPPNQPYFLVLQHHRISSTSCQLLSSIPASRRPSPSPICPGIHRRPHVLLPLPLPRRLSLHLLYHSIHTALLMPCPSPKPNPAPTKSHHNRLNSKSRAGEPAPTPMRTS